MLRSLKLPSGLCCELFLIDRDFLIDRVIQGDGFLYYIDGSNEYYANPHVIGVGDRAVFIGAILCI
jgi:hypothetical protein